MDNILSNEESWTKKSVKENLIYKYEKKTHQNDRKDK